MSLDIECQCIDGKFIPYAVGQMDSNSFISRYGLDCVRSILEDFVGWLE